MVGATIIASSTSAQLQNGSFEDSLGNADLDHWQWYCNMQSAPSTAPSSGNWCALVAAGNVKGCFPGIYFQTIPSINDGEVYTLSGWCRTVSGPFQPDIGLFIGRRDTSGFVTSQNGITTNDTSWTWLSVTDTFHLGALDTATVILNAGTLGGPAYAQAEFDGIVLEAVGAEAIDDPSTEPVAHLYDPQTQTLFIHAVNGALDPIAVYDMTGRRTKVPIHRSSGGTTEADVSSLPTGVYFVQLGITTAVVRFVKR